ncbi:MAG: MFS transporter [Gemmatimonadaceae bacterium]
MTTPQASIPSADRSRRREGAPALLAPDVDPRRWQALFLLCAAQFIVILDTSIIGVALPAIQRALGFSQEGLSWIFNAYVIAFGGLLLLGGRLSDLFGSRRIFMLGFLTLTVASLVAGLAPSQGVLIAGRALQGLGAALIAPAALTIVMSLFATRPPELGKALGFWGAAAAAGGTAGVFLGGVITQWLSWRWTFLINVPLGLVVLALSPTLLSPGQIRRGSVDYAGAIAVTGALVVAVYAIVAAPDAGWMSVRTIGLLVIAAVLLGAFFMIQRRRHEPLIPLRIFAAPNLSAANVVMATLAGAWIPLWFFLNLYLQQVLGYSAFRGGLALLPMTLAIMILMVGFTERFIGRFGIKPNLVAGLVLMAAALLLFAQTPVEGSFVAHVLPASLLAALGMSLAYIPGTIMGMSGARQEETGLASGLINTSYQIGSALGLAAMVAAATARTAGEASGAGMSTALGASARVAALNAGFHMAFTGAAIIAAIGAVLALVWIRSPKPAGSPSVP